MTPSERGPDVAATRSGDLAEGLNRLVERTVSKSRRVRHLMLGVAAMDGSFRWTGAAGIAREDGTPATAGTPYPIASITKLYTATAVLLLHERGQLALTDHLVDLLPDKPLDRLLMIDGVDRTGEITVRHLLAQTSGLPDFYEQAPRGGRSVGQRLHAGEDFALDLDEILRVVRDELRPHSRPVPARVAAGSGGSNSTDGMPQGRRPARPGRAWYGNTNYQLLGAVIERVTGSPLHQAFDEMLFAPVGLTDTYVFPHRPAGGPAGGPIADVWAGNSLIPTDKVLRALGPDGGLISTLNDQLDFMQALVGGRIFVDPRTYSLMHEQWNRIFFPLQYGLGTMRLAMPRLITLPFRVPEMIGHSGSTGTWLYHCPELDVVLAGSIDQAVPRSLPFRIIPRIARLIQAHSAR